MFYKLALKNVTKSIRDFTVYFLTLTFGVCLFYMFNSIDSQTSMLSISQSKYEIMKTLTSVIDYVSVFISVILGFLVVYANQFLIKRRKKELAVYMTLGMSKGKISRIVVLETLIIGIVSLAVGLLVGVFASQGLSVVTARLFEANLKSFTFVFSTGAFYKTMIYFGIIFLIVMVFNTASISKYKLIDLLNASKKNQKLRLGQLWVSVVLFLVSAAILAVSYHLIIENGLVELNAEFTASIVLGSIGTLLFFLSLSGFLLRVVKSNKKLYFRNLNMFVLRQINSKINTTFVSMSVICIMLLITIGTLSTGMGLADVLTKDLKASTPYDASFWYYYSYGPNDLARNKLGDDIAKQMINQGVNFNLVRGYAQITGYESELKYGDLILPGSPVIESEAATNTLKPQGVTIITQGDYNKAMQLQGKPTVSLKEDEFLINCNYSEIQPLVSYFLNKKGTVQVNGKNLHTQSTQPLENTYQTNAVRSDIGTLIVPDSAIAGLQKTTSILDIQYKPNVTDETFLASFDKVYPDTDSRNDQKPFQMQITRQRVYDQAAGLKTIISYLALYIGLVFLITSAAVLALQQLSEASDNMERYALLKKLGTEEKMIHRSLFTQIAIYFMLPLSLAIVHSVVGIHVANMVVAQFGHLDILNTTLVTAAIFLFVYGGYFLATYFGSKSMLRQK